jgi:hypothetical protein
LLPAEIDVFTVFKMELNQAFKGQGLEGALLADALNRVIRSEITAYAMVVDA